MSFHCVCLAVATNSKLDDSPHKIGVTLSEMDPFQGGVCLVDRWQKKWRMAANISLCLFLGVVH